MPAPAGGGGVDPAGSRVVQGQPDTGGLADLLTAFQQIGQATQAAMDRESLLDILALRVIKAGVFRSLMGLCCMNRVSVGFFLLLWSIRR